MLQLTPVALWLILVHVSTLYTMKDFFLNPILIKKQGYVNEYTSHWKMSLGF